jgi:sigma-B regulation protein RsbQ
MPRLLPWLILLLLLVAGACSRVVEEGVEDPSPRSGSTPSVDGVPIAYEIRGAGSPALVFVHGWCCDRGFWSAQTGVFSSEHRVIALDLGAHGESGGDRETWDLAILAHDVTAVVEELQLDRVILIGHSMGGPVSLLASEMLGDRVVGVIGVDTLQDAEYEWDEETLAPFLAQMEADFVGTAGAMIRSMFPEGVDSSLVEEVVTAMCSMDPDVAMGLMRSYVGLDLRAAFRACPAPVRCINATGENPTELETNRKYAPSFDYVGMEGVGHFLMMEQPEAFNAILREMIGELGGS